MLGPRLLRRSLFAVALVLAFAFGVLWLTPSNHFLFVPDPARPTDPLVSVPNEPQQPEDEASGIYMVDVLVREANLLHRFFPDLVEGSTLVPEQVVNPRGVSDEQRRKSSLNEMSRSQEIAIAVALRELGYEVEAAPFGVEVVLIRPESTASGILEPGDVIVEAQGREIELLSDLADVMQQVAPGEEVTITVRRDESSRDYTFGTTAADNDPDRAVIGIEIQQAADIELPVDVQIDAGNIGGPSAGLAWALHVVDELGEDIDEGRRIVVTGELDLEGNVGRIGGIKQKTLGAEKIGADVFVVPEENAEEARRHAEDVEIVAVSTFDEALSALTTS